MNAHHLERVVAAARSSASIPGSGFAAELVPPAELQVAVASAVSSGEPLAVVSAVAGLPSLAVLDALDALQPGRT